MNKRYTEGGLSVRIWMCVEGKFRTHWYHAKKIAKCIECEDPGEAIQKAVPAKYLKTWKRFADSHDKIFKKDTIFVHKEGVKIFFDKQRKYNLGVRVARINHFEQWLFKLCLPPVSETQTVEAALIDSALKALARKRKQVRKLRSLLAEAKKREERYENSRRECLEDVAAFGYNETGDLEILND